MNKPKGPIVVEYDQNDPPAPDLSEAPPVPDPVGDLVPTGQAMQTATRVAAVRLSWMAKLFWAAVLALLSIWIGTLAWDTVIALVDRNLWLGRAVLVLGGLALFAAAIMIAREIAALLRLGRLDSIRKSAERVRQEQDLSKARALTGDLARLYAGRDDATWGLNRFQEGAAAETLDADALLDLAEREILHPLDTAAQSEIEAAARQVALMTAIVPLTFADVVVALTSNLRMIRRIAEIYGGRAGRVGSWRLLRAVATHLAATGLVGAADDMIGSIAGGGAIAKVSRRFGEGIVNGALTARVGVAAMEVCRPVPFQPGARPSVSGVVAIALKGLFSKS